MRRVASHRPAFTLIELLVVIGIVALLATLSAAAVMRVQESQRESTTNVSLRKAHMGLDQQWKAAVDMIGRETPHEAIFLITSNSNCGRDTTRAKALHMRLRLRQEFPQNYAEARYQFSGQFATPNCGSIPDLRVLNAMYGPKPIYLAAIGNGNGSLTDEAAALLLVVLAQNRGGVQFNAQESGSVESIDIGGKSMPVLIDAWSRPNVAGHNPICLRRCATDVEVAARDELNLEPFVTKGAITKGYKDPADPEGKLTQQGWSTGLPNARALAASWFTSPLPQVADPFDGLNRGPFVMSAGKDRNYVTADDLYSFRIQGLGKGN